MSVPSITQRRELKEEQETGLEHSDLGEQSQPQYSPSFWNSIFREYNFQELLTQTDGSLIWLGRKQKGSQRLVLKITERIKIESSRCRHQRQEKSFLQNIRIEHMVDIKQIKDEQDFRLVVMKYYPWSLEEISRRYLAHSSQRYTQQHCRFVVFVFRGMVRAIEEMHALGYVHRDLKLDNFMVDPEYNVYLNDFELVTCEEQIDGSLSGTLDYMPPERLESKKRQTLPIRQSIDIWALGIMLAELFTGDTPYHGHSQADLLDEIYSRNINFKQIPQQMMKLIQGMLQITPEKRPTLKQIQSSKIWQQEVTLSMMKKMMRQ